MPAGHFLIAGLTLVLIDLLLAGDNALVIAMAVRSPAPARAAHRQHLRRNAWRWFCGWR